MKNIVSRIVSLACLGIVLISSVKGSRGYPYADCTYVKPDSASTYYGGRCFCYTSPGIKWKDYWSTFQVRISSRDEVVIVYPMKPRTCRHAEDLLQLATCLMEHYWLLGVQKESSVDLPLVEKEVFFMAQAPTANTEYTLQVSKHRFNWMRFFLFVSGLALFFFAGSVCRSSIFFYISAISLGTSSILLFLVLVLRNFIPSRGLFLLLFSAASGFSYVSIQNLINEWEKILKLYWRELIGYLLVSGVVSLLVCYLQGPVTSRRTLSVMTWALQAVGVALACHGVTYAPVSWLVLSLLLGLKLPSLLLTLVLPVLGQVCWLLRTLRGLFQRRRSSRLLTEEEYREQAVRYTSASLEELRRYCRNPGFPTWDTVLRLRDPQRFAEFLKNGAHVTPSEAQSHGLHRHRGFDPEHDENTPEDSHTRARTADFSNDKVDTHTRQTSNLNSFSPPLPLPPPALCSAAAYIAPICPYPPIAQNTLTPYPPTAPKRPLADDDEPF